MTQGDDQKKRGINEAVQAILADYRGGRDIDRMDFYAQPDRAQVENIVRKLFGRIFNPPFATPRSEETTSPFPNMPPIIWTGLPIAPPSAKVRKDPTRDTAFALSD